MGCGVGAVVEDGLGTAPERPQQAFAFARDSTPARALGSSPGSQILVLAYASPVDL